MKPPSLIRTALLLALLAWAAPRLLAQSETDIQLLANGTCQCAEPFLEITLAVEQGQAESSALAGEYRSFDRCMRNLYAEVPHLDDESLELSTTVLERMASLCPEVQEFMLGAGMQALPSEEGISQYGYTRPPAGDTATYRKLATEVCDCATPMLPYFDNPDALAEDDGMEKAAAFEQCVQAIPERYPQIDFDADATEEGVLYYLQDECPQLAEFLLASGPAHPEEQPQALEEPMIEENSSHTEPE